MRWKNELTNMLGIDYPVIQAPMLGVTTPEMVAGAANAGCLGSLSLGDLNADQCIASIQATKRIISKTFAVNIFTHTIPEITENLRENYTKARHFIEDLALRNNLEVTLADLDDIKTHSYHEQIDAIISENCKILSFTFGNLDMPSIEKLKSNETILIGTCTSVEEAIVLEKSGIDIVCVQGIEAGGHRGSFLHSRLPEIGGISLLSQVRDSVKVPLIYAGGVNTPRTLLAAQTLGAQAVQTGSLLIGSRESALRPFEKQRLKTLEESDIVLTKSFSGRYARGVKNIFTETLEKTDFILPYPYQNKLTNELRKMAKLLENKDFVSIWAGQSINKYEDLPTKEILENLITTTESYCLSQ